MKKNIKFWKKDFLFCETLSCSPRILPCPTKSQLRYFAQKSIEVGVCLYKLEEKKYSNSKTKIATFRYKNICLTVKTRMKKVIWLRKCDNY